MAEKGSKRKTAKKKSTTKKPVKIKDKPAADIGIDVTLPTQSCEDQFCPFHGRLSTRGQILEGTVITERMQNAVVVKSEYLRKIEKYERLEKRSNKYLVHNPPCLDVKSGDYVKIMECRPLSKKISFVVIENLGGR